MTVDQRLRPRKQPVQPRAHETRGRILEAAARVFAERGYSAGTTNRIAAAAGLSVGSLYQYFPNKDAILVELSRAHVNDGVSRLQLFLADQLPAGIEAQLRAAVETTIAVHDGNFGLHRVLFEEAPQPADLRDDLRRAEDAFTEAVATLLVDDPDVHVRDVHLAARLVVTTIESLVHRFITRDPDDVDIDAFADELVRMLMSYLTCSPAAAAGRRPGDVGRVLHPH